MAANGAKRMGAVRGSRKSWRNLLAAGAIAAAALTWSHAIDGAGAADRKAASDSVFVSELSDVRRVTVILNKSRTFKVERPSRPLSPVTRYRRREAARRPHDLCPRQADRTTNIVLFDDAARQIGVLDVEVTIDTGNLSRTSRAARRRRHSRPIHRRTGDFDRNPVDAVAAEKAMAIATGAARKAPSSSTP